MYRADPNEPKSFERWWEEYVRGMHYAVVSGLKSSDEAHKAIADAAFNAGMNRAFWSARNDDF